MGWQVRAAVSPSKTPEKIGIAVVSNGLKKDEVTNYSSNSREGRQNIGQPK
eukprot:CAMPEP_0177533698 /NCGR_PEP_ID=MMETSP0369-20130122/55468_1 /TAXON_ID=447022 ORGANISM="Scrippsiella hangoei-like, Strain SHHI-4" /NCGR_SAMPLE_ID=MMETSP0369 /ASSEMBLY_ACC=CAM_ASM_000364 /LENGTH=50 /DNA_ID=CAMNT_0019015431 /DNA_START=71 /DNA_END=220 /DNA_ORIENTATION=+